MIAGVMSVIAGSKTQGVVDGVCSSAQFNFPHGLLCSADGTSIFVTEDRHIRCIRNGQVSTIVNEPGLASMWGMAFDVTTPIPESVLYVASDTGLERVNLPKGWVPAPHISAVSGHSSYVVCCLQMLEPC
jgi:hypothetical protein